VTDIPPRSSFEDHQLDPRDAVNMVALFRPALIETGDFRSFCLVRNISPWGLIAAFHGLPVVGQPISVRFSEAMKIRGTIVWFEAERIGMAFSKAINVPAFLDELGSNRTSGKDYRPPRLSVQVPGNFIVLSKAHPLIVRDISQRGIKASVEEVSVGVEGTLEIQGLHPRRAVVRWVRQATASFYFIIPLSFTELGKWVLDLRRQRRRRNGS
jgi:hypothetical protein